LKFSVVINYDVSYHERDTNETLLFIKVETLQKV